MRILKINGKFADIDDKTAIGIDAQSYDIATPSERKVNVSNDFDIPLTSNNKKIIGYINNVQSEDETIYSRMVCDYWVNSIQLITNGQVLIKEVGERIKLSVVEKEDIWDSLKKYKWEDFIIDWMEWCPDRRRVFPVGVSFSSLQYFAEYFRDTSLHAHLSFYYGNLFKKDVEGLFVEQNKTIWLEDLESLGGHMSIFVKSVFQFLEYKFSVNFNTANTDISNIFMDEIAKKMYVPARRLTVKIGYEPFEIPTILYFLDYDGVKDFAPNNDAKDKGGKSMYDFFKVFIQHFNCIVEKRGENNFFMSRFDDIATASEENFDNGIVGIPIMYPLIDGYSQINYIKFSNVAEGRDPLSNAKLIRCENENIDTGGSEKALVTINANIPSFYVVDSGYVADLSESKSFEDFQFFIDSTITSNVIVKTKQVHDSIYGPATNEYTATLNLPNAAVYSLSGEYNVLASMARKPKRYVIKKWMSLKDINEFQFFKRRWVTSLNGYFFVNKISGFNPESKEPTSIELIKLP